ncbi:unnamed protein product, partial [Nesidiocoris tenuis]
MDFFLAMTMYHVLFSDPVPQHHGGSMSCKQLGPRSPAAILDHVAPVIILLVVITDFGTIELALMTPKFIRTAEELRTRTRHSILSTGAMNKTAAFEMFNYAHIRIRHE